MIEEFIDIQGFEGLYQVSNLGRVKSFKRNKEKIKTLCVGTTGYYHTGLIKEGKQLDNLQLISSRENSSKDKKGGSSEYTGVCWDRSRGKWISSIIINGKRKTLGRFTEELEASKAYQNALNAL